MDDLKFSKSSAIYLLIFTPIAVFLEFLHVGYAAEIIIAIVAINAGLLELVKASITGAILGNIMLIFGLSMIAGGLRHKEQVFNKKMQVCSHH